MIEFLKDPFGRKAIRILFVSLKQAERRERELSQTLKLTEKSELELSQIADRLDSEIRDLSEINKKLSSRLQETGSRLSTAERERSEYEIKLNGIADLISFSVGNVDSGDEPESNQAAVDSSDEQEYRPLGMGEVIQVDDEFFLKGEWLKTEFTGHTVDHIAQQYRRRINPRGN